jgi:hypothetical protein
LNNNGSFLQLFDNVPIDLRVGAWNYMAILYVAGMIGGIILTGIYNALMYQSVSTTQGPPEFIDYTSFDALQIQYPRYNSTLWWYNCITFIWISNILYGTITQGSPIVLIAYTMQSFTLLTIRHLCVALIPFSIRALRIAEMIRVPCFVSPMITFVVCNIGLKTTTVKRIFIEYCTSFRMINLHFMNIIFCMMNVIYSTPSRTIYWLYDFYMVSLFFILYVNFILGILDCFGIHLYPIFSPRLPAMMILMSYTINIVYFIYCGTYITIMIKTETYLMTVVATVTINDLKISP